jgi:hypothetical protein
LRQSFISYRVWVALVVGCWHCLLAGSCLAADPDTQPSPGSTVYLDLRDRPPYPIQTGLIAWELFRQSVLIATRDQLGLQTRDASLREWPTNFNPPTVFRLSLDKRKLQLHELTGQSDQVIWKGTIDGEDWPNNLAGLAVMAEKLSRDDFPQALQIQGFSAQPYKFNSYALAPAEAEPMLSQLDEFSQFAAVRLTHAAIRESGESLPRLGVLVRGYANLSQLTRYHWSLESKAYGARALLYAQRMVAHDPNSAFALWHRAYAETMLGLQRSALDDLAAADKLNPTNSPNWVMLLEPTCKYQPAKVLDLAAKEPSLTGLGAYLAFLTVDTNDSSGVVMKFGQNALQANPNCLRLIDRLCDFTGQGVLDELVNAGPKQLRTILGDRLRAIPGVRGSTIDLAAGLAAERNPANQAAVAQSLIADGAPDKDDGEPSFTALGRLMQEASFAQMRRGGDFFAESQSVDASDFASQVWPIVSDHPFANIIKVYGLLEGKHWNSIAPLLDQQPYDRLTMTFFKTLYDLVDEARGKKNSTLLLNAQFRNLDCTSFDVEPMLDWYGEDTATSAPWLIDWLNFVSPNSPLLIVEQLHDHWDSAKAKTWETDYRDSATIQKTLAEQYIRLQRWADAERCAKAFIALSPEQYSYELLAGIYWKEERHELWLATLQDYLKQPDYGLQHASVQVQIANYYMKSGKYEEALPYADSAAETGVWWAADCAAEAHTGAGDWKTAEDLVTGHSETPYNWWAWCVRTGHGDRATAEKELDDYLSDPKHTLSTDEKFQLGTLRILQKRESEAIAAFPDGAKGHVGVLALLHIAILQDAAGNADARDLALQRALEKATHGSALYNYLNLLVSTFGAGRDAMPDTGKVDEILKTAKHDDRLAIAYLTARCLDKGGKTDQATDYLRKGIAGQSNDSFDTLLIADALAQRGIDPAPLERATTKPSH